MATLKIKTGLTRMRFGLTSWRGGSLSYYLDGERVGAHDVTTYRPLKIEIAPGEHVLEMRQEGLREGHVRTARVSFEVTAGESSQVMARARPARRLWVSSSNPIDDIKLVSHP